MQAERKPTETQNDEAALWHAKRAGGSMSAAQELEFDAWINADKGNRLAFDQMRVLWAQIEEPARRVSTSDVAKTNRLQSVLDWFSPKRAVAGFVGVGMAAGLLFFLNPDVVENFQADIVSDEATVTDVKLADGSVVHLAANSALSTDFENGRREVSLLRGQALFDVVHRNGDPFRVHAGLASIRVVGTQFNVEYLSQRTEVGVVEGAVRVSAPSDKDGVLLVPGQSVTVGRGPLNVLEDQDVETMASWMHGRLSVRNTSVDELVARLDNFDEARFVVLGSIGERTVSGSFPTTDVSGSLETIAAVVGGTVVKTSPWLTVVY